MLHDGRTLANLNLTLQFNFVTWATVRHAWAPLCALAACGGGAAAPDGGDAIDAHVIDAHAIDARVIDPGPLPAPDAIAGPLTITAWGAQPFLTPASIPEVVESGFSIGRELFVAAWVVAPSAQRPTIDGLGPLFHAPSCVACHPATGRPRSLDGAGGVGIGVLFRLARPDGGVLRPDPVFGGQLQPAAIAGVPAEAAVAYTTEPPPPGIAAASARPVFAFTPHPTYGALAATTRAGPRLSPHLAGVGLVEAVDAAAIVAREDPLDADGDGVSGRAARLPGGAIGRFGWKAVQADLRGQTAAAFAGDIGIASPGHADDCTATQAACLASPSGGAPELGATELEDVDIFMRYLGVPAARRANDDPAIVRGHALFADAGCAACHRPTLVTSAAATPTVLAGVTFHPYTDLLLHDLGPGLADELGEGDAAAAEWRTPPLWGLGLVAADPAARFLHDGRAATLADAIRWHGGEAAQARDAFAAMSPTDTAALLAFLTSL